MSHNFLFAVLVANTVHGAFDLQRAIDGVYYSKIAYCTEAGIKAWNSDACPKFPTMKNVSVVQSEFDLEQSWLGYDPTKNTIVLGYRGTENPLSWVANLDFFQVDYFPLNKSVTCPGCKVHGGLWDQYKDTTVSLLPKLQALADAYPTALIQISGHSSGAACAGFAFPDVMTSIRGAAGRTVLYNYGSPRLGNTAWSEWHASGIFGNIDEIHFRATNYEDPIPHLPPQFIGDWQHIPREVFWKNNFGPPQDYKICDGTPGHEDQTCADSSPAGGLSMTHHTTYLDIGLGCFLQN